MKQQREYKEISRDYTTIKNKSKEHFQNIEYNWLKATRPFYIKIVLEGKKLCKD